MTYINLKTTFRIYKKTKTVTLINIFGLSIGIAVCLLISQYVAYNLSYDKFNKNHENLYRIERAPFATIAPSFIPLLRKDFPEIQKIARTTANWTIKVKYKEKAFIEEDFCAAESNIFDVLSFDFIKGNKENALQEGNIVLTEPIAKKYFGNEDPIGKTLILDDELYVTVSAVIKEYPKNSHFSCNILGSYLSLRDNSVKLENDYFLGNNNFSDNVTFAYLTLKEHTNVNHVMSKLPKFIDRYLPAGRNNEGQEIPASTNNRFDLVKVTDIHLHSHKWNEIKINGDISYIYLFSSLVVLIILIACINFFNLCISTLNARSKEIGTKKVFGIRMKNIRAQFFIESFILILLATLVAFVMVILVQPYLKSFLELSEHTVLTRPVYIAVGTILLVLFLSSVTSFIPSIYIKRKNIPDILKGKALGQQKHFNYRNAMVIFQFVIAIGLFISIGMVHKQIQFIKTKDLGFDKSNIIITPVQNIKDKWDMVHQRLTSHPNIANASLSHSIVGNRLLDAPGLQINLNGKWQHWPVRISHVRTDHHFFKTYIIDIIEGRDFRKEINSDTEYAFILNESAVRKLGVGKNSEVIGKQIRTNGKAGKVIGVAKDFNYESLHNDIVPMVFYIAVNSTGMLSVKTINKADESTLGYIKTVLRDYERTLGFNYTAFEDHLANQYKNEHKMMVLILYASILAIIIAVLGLLGLSLVIIRNRIKEIGVHKVNGAKVKNILALLNADVIKWIIIAFTLACPISWFAMQKWLENFAYKAVISWWLFAAAGGTALCIAILTVSVQSWRAANRNPVEALRYE